MGIWSARPRLSRLGLFFAAYVLGCGFAQALAIVPGTGISIWAPGGLFIATLVLASKRSWPWWVLAGGLAELFSNELWFHSPLSGAALIYAGNALGATTGAWLVHRASEQPARLDTLKKVLAFVGLAAGIAPLASATVGAAALQWFGIPSKPFAQAWLLWWIGDATGTLIVAPLALTVLQNWRGSPQLSVARWIEAGVLGLIFFAVAALSLSGRLPFAYIVMPPLLWAAVRFEFKGAAVALILLALITAIFTISGDSQLVGDPESQSKRQIMLQLFLAISAFTALVVAAISRQHQQVLSTLRQSERELSQLVNMVPSHLWRLSDEGDPVFFSKRMVEYLGLDVGGYDRPGTSGLAAAIAAVIHPDDASRLHEALRHSIATGESFAMRYRVRRADGVTRWMDGRAEPLRDEDGRILQWYGMLHDIDDQVHAEQALRESEKQARALVDALPTHIWAATAAGEPSYLNRRLAEYVGLTVNDLDVPELSRLQMAIVSSVHPDDSPAVGLALRHSFGTGETFAMKYRQRRADGVYRWISGRAEPLRDPDGRILQWYGLNFDIDDDVRTQEELRRTQERLAVASQAASLAELSASIAHEVNQPLAAIVANSHACHRWLSAEPANVERAKVTVERMIRDANSAADVVSRIHALFKHSTESRSLTMLAAVIAEARELMAEEASRRVVRVDIEVEKELPPVALDRVQIQQVLVNLMRNGMEAMHGVAGERVLRLGVHRAGELIRTEISDLGPGIEFPERIFDPFFTTKGNGMGMGLAISRSIVEGHGGRLWAENGEPHGATFIFTLPLETSPAHGDVSR